MSRQFSSQHQTARLPRSGVKKQQSFISITVSVSFTWDHHFRDNPSHCVSPWHMLEHRFTGCHVSILPTRSLRNMALVCCFVCLFVCNIILRKNLGKQLLVGLVFPKIYTDIPADVYLYHTNGDNLASYLSQSMRQADVYTGQVYVSFTRAYYKCCHSLL